jgi:rhomboid protease GluP
LAFFDEWLIPSEFNTSSRLKPLIILTNGLVVLASSLCASRLYGTRWKRDAHQPRRQLPATFLIIGVTLAISLSQFVWPELIATLARNKEALAAGEWWRLVTPLFVQPGGWLHLLFNCGFLFCFLPIAERIYGPKIALIYFASGIVGQAVNYAWAPYGGGASTAAFGTMGSLLACTLFDPAASKAYRVFPLLGLSAATAMIFTRDGHGPGLLTGAFLGAVLILSQRENARVLRN